MESDLATPRIHTIGYERRDGIELVRSLIEARVEFLVDVRAVPMSRKPDFRKTRLAELLGQAGIRYVGVPGLGTPKFLRDKLARDGNYAEFFDRFRYHVESSQEQLESVARLATHRRISMMCFERDPQQCHRIVLAEKVAELISSRILHL